MGAVHRHDVELKEGEIGAGKGGTGIHNRINPAKGENCQQQALQNLDTGKLETGVIKGSALLAPDKEEHQQIKHQEHPAYYAVKQHQGVHRSHIEEAIGHELGKEFEPLGLHVVGITDQPVVQQGRGQQEDDVGNDIADHTFGTVDGAHGRCRRTHDGGEEGNTQQGECQRNEGDQRSNQPDQATGGTTVPYLLGGVNGSNAAPQGDIKEIDAVADGGLVIIGIGMGTVKAISGTNGLHGHGSAGGSSHRFLTGEGRGAGIAVHKVGAGGNIGSAAGAVGELKAGGVLAGILHAPQKTGEFIVGALNGADVDRRGIQREYAVFGGNADVGQVVDVADIVIITGEYHRTG